jgi:hypothetical protein
VQIKTPKDIATHLERPRSELEAEQVCNIKSSFIFPGKNLE